MSDSPELKRIASNAIAFLTPLSSANLVQMVAALKPHDADYDLVFIGDAAAQARLRYEEMWANPPRGFGKRGQTEVQAVAAQAKMLVTENDFSREFPGGYRKIADRLVPDRVWVRFKFVEPGRSTGMAYDGLVWMDGRWAWFPKPWQALGIDQSN